MKTLVEWNSQALVRDGPALESSMDGILEWSSVFEMGAWAPYTFFCRMAMITLTWEGGCKN